MGGSPLDPERRLDPQGVRRMQDLMRIVGSLHVDIDSLLIGFGLGRAPTGDEAEILKADARDLVAHAREMQRLVQEVVGLWRQGKHHAAFERDQQKEEL